MTDKKVKIAVIVIAAVLVAALAAGIVIAVVYTVRENSTVDFMNDDLSRYVYISAEDYKGLELDVKIPAVDEDDVNNEIIKQLYKNRGKTMYGGGHVSSKPLMPGYDAFIKYMGYELDESGNKVVLENTCNFADEKYHKLGIGSGEFVKGFELGLVGKVPDDCSELKVSTQGGVINKGDDILGVVQDEGDVVYITLSYVREEEGAIHSKELVRIDLNRDDVEAQWGVGFIELLQADDMYIGVPSNKTVTLKLPETDEAITYTYMEILYTTRGENNPFVVKTVFPYNYHDESMRNKEVYFDVYVEDAFIYEIPDFDEDFITEKLGISAESLDSYEGEGLAEKYKAKLRADFAAEYEKSCQSMAEELLWERLNEKAEIKKLPENEVDRIFDNYYYNFQLQYMTNYQEMYENIDEYVSTVYYGSEEIMDWRGSLYAQCEAEVREKLIFYYIMRNENLIPTDAEYAELYKEELAKDFTAELGKDKDDFATEEAYNTELAKFEEQMLDYYGESFYRETVYYNHIIKKLLAYNTVVNSMAT